MSPTRQSALVAIREAYTEWGFTAVERYADNAVLRLQPGCEDTPRWKRFSFAARFDACICVLLRKLIGRHYLTMPLVG